MKLMSIAISHVRGVWEVPELRGNVGGAPKRDPRTFSNSVSLWW